MVWTSSQASAVFAQQQQGFMQQAQRSQQIGAQLQGAPMPEYMKGYENPAPGMARGIAAAGAGVIPFGAGAAHSLGAHFAPSVFNPFQAAQAGFAAGGNMGMGTMGAGMMGLGAAAVPMAGMAAANYAGSQVFEGARQTAGFRQQAQANMSFINTSSMTGRGAATGQVVEMTKVMRDVATETFSDFDEMQKIFQSMTDMGMMQTVRNAKDFERKFKTLTKSAKEVSRIMGTTMEEAAGLVGSMRLSGMYKPDEVMGQAVQRGVLSSHGLTGQQITQQQAQGAQMAHGIGAFRGTGARLTTRMTGDVARAAATGVLSSEQLLEATGKEGAEAYAAFGQKMTSTALGFTGTGVGQAMMAIAGEREGERYTGKVDAGKMAMLQNMDPSKLAGLAQKAMGSSQEARASFVSQKDRLRGAFAESAGTEEMSKFATKLVKERYGNVGEDDMVSHIMKMFGDLDRTEAEMMVEMADKSKELSDARKREEEMELRRISMEQNRVFNRSLQGAKMKLSRTAKRLVGTPLQNVGAGMERKLTEIGESMSDTIYGRTTIEGVSQTQMDDILTGDRSQPMGPSGMAGQTVGFSGFTNAAQSELRSYAPGWQGNVVVGENISEEAMASIAGRQRRDILNLSTAEEFGMEGTTDKELLGLGRRASGYLEGVDRDSNLATEQIAANILKDKNADPKLRAALEKTLGLTKGGSRGITNVRQFRGHETGRNTDRMLRRALADAGIKIGGSARLDATSQVSAEAISDQREEAVSRMTSGMGMTDRWAIERLTGDEETRDDVFSAVRGKSKEELQRMAMLGGEEAALSEEDAAMFGGLEGDDRKAVGALAANLAGMDEQGRMRYSGNKAYKRTMADALAEADKYTSMKGRAADDRLMSRIGVSGAKFSRALGGREDAFDDIGGGAAFDLAKEWGAARASGARDFGTSKAVELQELLKGDKDRSAILSELGATEGGASLVQQVQLLERGGKRMSKGGLRGAKTFEDVEAFMNAEGVGIGAGFEKAIRGAVESDGKLDAGEIDEIVKSAAQGIGGSEAAASAAVGGKMQKTLGGETMEIARALSDMSVSQSRYNTETADALQKVSKVGRGLDAQIQDLKKGG